MALTVLQPVRNESIDGALLIMNLASLSEQNRMAIAQFAVGNGFTEADYQKALANMGDVKRLIGAKVPLQDRLASALGAIVQAGCVVSARAGMAFVDVMHARLSMHHVLAMFLNRSGISPTYIVNGIPALGALGAGGLASLFRANLAAVAVGLVVGGAMRHHFGKAYDMVKKTASLSWDAFYLAVRQVEDILPDWTLIDFQPDGDMISLPMKNCRRGQLKLSDATIEIGPNGGGVVYRPQRLESGGKKISVFANRWPLAFAYLEHDNGLLGALNHMLFVYENGNLNIHVAPPELNRPLRKLSLPNLPKSVTKQPDSDWREIMRRESINSNPALTKWLYRNNIAAGKMNHCMFGASSTRQRNAVMSYHDVPNGRKQENIALRSDNVLGVLLPRGNQWHLMVPEDQNGSAILRDIPGDAPLGASGHHLLVDDKQVQRSKATILRYALQTDAGIVSPVTTFYQFGECSDLVQVIKDEDASIKLEMFRDGYKFSQKEEKSLPPVLAGIEALPNKHVINTVMGHWCILCKNDPMAALELLMMEDRVDKATVSRAWAEAHIDKPSPSSPELPDQPHNPYQRFLKLAGAIGLGYIVCRTVGDCLEFSATKYGEIRGL